MPQASGSVPPSMQYSNLNSNHTLPFSFLHLNRFESGESAKLREAISKLHQRLAAATQGNVMAADVQGLTEKVGELEKRVVEERRRAERTEERMGEREREREREREVERDRYSAAVREKDEKIAELEEKVWGAIFFVEFNISESVCLLMFLQHEMMSK